jgi:drug/metabolite transporter (DMT)-like permease
VPRLARPYLVLVVVCSGWGSIGVLVRDSHLPAGAVAAGRIWVATLGLTAVLWARRWRGAAGGAGGGAGVPPPLWRHRPGLLVATGLVLAAHWLTFIAALTRAPIGIVVLIVFLAPVGVAAAAPRVLDERVGRGTLAALAVAVAGFALVAVPAAARAHASGAVGLGLAVVSGFLAVALTLASKPLAEIHGGLRTAFGELAVASVAVIPVGAVAHWGHPHAAWLWIVLLGLLHTALAVSLYLAALAVVPATHAAILGYLEPAGAVLFGWWFLAERPGVSEVLGGLLIVAAGVTLVRSASARGARRTAEVVGVAG